MILLLSSSKVLVNNNNNNNNNTLYIKQMISELEGVFFGVKGHPSNCLKMLNNWMFLIGVVILKSRKKEMC